MNLKEIVAVLKTFISEFPLKPTYRLKGNLSRLNLDLLRRDGIKGMILDLDNTLMIPGSGILFAELAAWLREAQAKGFKLIILTNNSKKHYLDKVDPIFRDFSPAIEMIRKGCKPFPEKIRESIDKLALSDEAVCIVGDRVITDLLGGLHLSIKTIFVDPLIGFQNEIWYKRLGRKLEYAMLGHAENNL